MKKKMGAKGRDSCCCVYLICDVISLHLSPYLSKGLSLYLPSAPLPIHNSHTLTRPMEKMQIEHSDVISFHSYRDLSGFAETVRYLRRYDRPILCTEYLARPMGSSFESHLPWAKDEKARLGWQTLKRLHSDGTGFAFDCYGDAMNWAGAISASPASPSGVQQGSA